MGEGSGRRLPVTAIVASHNEAELLPACLAGVSFCAEVIVIDIASRDDSAAVAERNGARVVRHSWVPIAEEARANVIPAARHDWILVRDPDEIIPAALAHEAAELFPRLEPDIALVAAPIQRYFAGRPLKGGVWGGVKRDLLLARRDAVEFPTSVHSKLKLKPGFRELEIAHRGDNAMRHYWVSGYRSFFQKHMRYLRLEGRARAEAGEITGWRAAAAVPGRSFWNSFVRERGYRDGLRGLTLGLLWMLYEAAAEIALLHEVRRRRRS